MENSNNSSKRKVLTPTSNLNSTGLSDELNDFDKTAEPVDGGLVIIEPPQTKTLPEIESEPAIEAGLVSEANKALPFHKEKHQAETSRKLAFSLVVVLAITIGIHYVTTIILELSGHHEAVESIEKIFNSWLPVIAGFVGGAVTYYFTKDK